MSLSKQNIGLQPCIELFDKNVSKFSDALSEDAISAFMKRLGAFQSSSQLNSLFHTAGSTGASSSGAGRGKIACQPTSIARRRSGMPRGAGPIGKGRKLKDCTLNNTVKRKRDLALTISLN